MKPDAVFDPFNDRLSRDIRNDLSVALMESLDTGDPEIVRRVAREYLDRNREKKYSLYIKDRLKRFDTVLKKAGVFQSADILRQAQIMWNQGLYFETHERIETLYHSSSGAQRKAYQGLIKAAGTYVHFERGAEKSAYRLAEKAEALLSQYHALLPSYLNLSLLIKKLRTKDPRPPRL